MKLVILIALFLIGLNGVSQELFICKVASPTDEKTNGKFVTLYNASDKTIDFDQTEYYIVRETNGGGTFGSKKLTGKIDPYSTYVIAGRTAFVDIYGKEPNCLAGCVTGNGNDAYFLYKNGDQTTGTLQDIFGEKGVDGTGAAWDYTNSGATRKSEVTQGKTEWIASEWVITKDLLAANSAPWNSNVIASALKISENEPQITIYPNPTTGTLFITSDEQINAISLFNASSIKIETILLDKIQYTTMNLTQLPKGVYILEITLNNGIKTTKKVIKD